MEIKIHDYQTSILRELLFKPGARFSELNKTEREFLEETGLSGIFTLKGIVHYHHFHKDGRLLEDKYFWIFRIDNTIGELKVKVLEGENIWMTEKEFRTLKNTFSTFDEMAEIINGKTLVYIDRKRFVEEY